MKNYLIKPTMTLPTVNTTPTPGKAAAPRTIPPRQPLPTAVLHPERPALQLGLDVQRIVRQIM